MIQVPKLSALPHCRVRNVRCVCDALEAHGDSRSCTRLLLRICSFLSQDHYCLVLGVNDGAEKLTNFGLKQQKQSFPAGPAGRKAGLPNAD